MKNFILASLLCGAVMVQVAYAQAQDAAVPSESENTLLDDFFKENNVKVAAAATVDYYDKYVWRGQYLDRDAVVQPGVSVTANGFTVGYWASAPMENKDALNSSESDGYVSYSKTEGIYTVTVGHTWYAFPGAGTSSKEFFGTLAAAMPLNPSLTYAHDYEDGSDLNTNGAGNYWALNINHSLPLYAKRGITLDLGTTVGIIDGQWLSGEGGHVTPTIGLGLPLSANVKIIPTFGYNVPFGDLSDENVGNLKPKSFGGVKSSFVF